MYSYFKLDFMFSHMPMSCEKKKRNHFSSMQSDVYRYFLNNIPSEALRLAILLQIIYSGEPLTMWDAWSRQQSRCLSRIPHSKIIAEVFIYGSLNLLPKQCRSRFQDDNNGVPYPINIVSYKIGFSLRNYDIIVFIDITLPSAIRD